MVIEKKWPLILLLLLCLPSPAQESENSGGTSHGPATFGATNPNPRPPAAVRGNILWDNTNVGATNNGVVSMLFGGLAPGEQLVNTADDFVVPAGSTWVVDFVHAEGFTNAVMLPDSFGIAFYEDDNGRPGNLIYEEEAVPPGGINTTLVDFPISTPFILTPGTYWLSVYGVYDTAINLLQTRWNWSIGPTAVGTQWHLQNMDTTGIFGTPFSWMPATALGFSDVSCVFYLAGEDQTVSIPTLGQWGLILFIALLLVAALSTMRRERSA